MPTSTPRPSDTATQGARLAIADPPYPPIRAAHPRNDSSRARRWYDRDYRKSGDARFASDHHEDAGKWDDPATHQALMAQLEAEYDGWAIATAHDGIPVYGILPRGAHWDLGAPQRRRWRFSDPQRMGAGDRPTAHRSAIKPPHGRSDSRRAGLSVATCWVRGSQAGAVDALGSRPSRLQPGCRRGD